MSRARNIAGFSSVLSQAPAPDSINTAGIITASEFHGDGTNLTGVGSSVGIQSGGTLIGLTTTLNFIGVGNTFVVNGDVIDIDINSGATGGGSDKVFVENQTTVNTDYTLTSGFNAMSVGPITVSAGTTVTIPSNRRWVIL